MDTDETFVCENCGTEFTVHAKMNFILQGDENSNTEEEKEQPIQQLSLF